MSATSLKTLSLQAQAIVYMLLAAVFASSMSVGIKMTGQNIPAGQIVWVRSAIAGIAMLPFLVPRGLAAFRSPRPALLLVRSVNATVIMLCGFYAVVHLPLVEVTALSFTKPFFLIVLAALFLGEVVRLRRTVATVLGFIGVLVILRPTVSIEFAAVSALAAAFFMAVGTVLVKKLADDHTPELLIFYAALGAVLLLAPTTLAGWVAPTPVEWIWLVLLGLLGTAAQACMIRAFYMAEATLIVPFEYTRILFAAAFGYLLFAEVPDIWTWIGAAIIVGTTIYITHREARIGKKPSPIAEATPKGI